MVAASTSCQNLVVSDSNCRFFGLPPDFLDISAHLGHVINSVTSIDRSTAVVRSLLGRSDISLNQIHALSVREINYYTIAKIVILQTINIVCVPRPVSHFQIVHSDFLDLCETHDIELKDFP